MSLSQEFAASHREEYGQDNVSQVIKLAELYNELARPNEARSALSALEQSDASAHGRMQMETERLSSAEQLETRQKHGTPWSSCKPVATTRSSKASQRVLI